MLTPAPTPAQTEWQQHLSRIAARNTPNYVVLTFADLTGKLHHLPTPTFCELEPARAYVKHSGGELYTWQSGEGGYNRLQLGVTTNLDVIGYALLSYGHYQVVGQSGDWPETIEMPDDELDTDDIAEGEE